MDATGEKRCNLQKDLSQCTICNHVCSKTILFVCNSGHVICANCQQNSVRQDCGDAMELSHKKCEQDKIYSIPKAKKQINIIFATEKKSYKDKSKCNITVIESINKDDVRKDGPKLMLKYENKDYKDSMSSMTSGNFPLSKQREVKAFVISRNNSLTRTIACPVCFTIISVNSIMLHFYFDHSKIPRLHLTKTESTHTILKLSEFDYITKCFTVLLKKSGKNQNIANNTKDKELCNSNNTTLLLMGSQINSSKHLDDSQGPEENYEIIKKEGGDNSSSQIRLLKYDTDNLMLWVCKLHDREVIYDITLTNEDRKLSYGYTGEAIHVKEEQDPQTMYQKAYCLMLQQKAAKRLIDHNGQFQVYINVH